MQYDIIYYAYIKYIWNIYISFEILDKKALDVFSDVYL